MAAHRAALVARRPRIDRPGHGVPPPLGTEPPSTPRRPRYPRPAPPAPSPPGRGRPGPDRRVLPATRPPP
ncbi:hypothetical protein STXM2123_1241 [Streptomyces sp. F-3]|nr:hypothetical protein STXM2123_1241 [Streptomyces sp. F-3]